MNSIKNRLLIDDDEIYTFLTKKIIERTHLAEKVKIFQNGKEAIDFLGQHSGNPEMLPKVIFLDISMPVMDGWGFLDEYIELKPLLPKKIVLYIISSSVSPRDHEKAKSYSEVVDFIIKPMNKERFTEIIKELG